MDKTIGIDKKKEEMSMLLSTRDLQNSLKIGRDTAYALMHCSGFPSMKIGGRYYVSRQELDKWLERTAYKTFIL
jgi:excisionase family DNA binding protein